MDLRCLVGKTLHRIILRKDGRIFSNKRVTPRRLVEVTGNALRRRERKKSLEERLRVLEVQELGQEGERLWIR